MSDERLQIELEALRLAREVIPFPSKGPPSTALLDQWQRVGVTLAEHLRRRLFDHEPPTPPDVSALGNAIGRFYAGLGHGTTVIVPQEPAVRDPLEEHLRDLERAGQASHEDGVWTLENGTRVVFDRDVPTPKGDPT